MVRVLDQSAYDLTVFKVHFGPLTLKLYDKGARVLRIEAIVHNIKGLRCGRTVEKLPIMLVELQRMVIDFLNVVQAAHRSYLPDGVLDELLEPSQRGQRRLAGVDLQKPRMRNIGEAVLALAPKPGGFTVAELAAKVRELLPANEFDYTPRHASYDLSKLRGKALVERIDNTRRYRTPPAGIRILAGMLILRENVIKPVLAGLGKPRVGRPPKNIQPIDQHYDNLQRGLRRIFFETLALAA
jgi:DNA-binding transcriptional ArsR family regulator